MKRTLTFSQAINEALDVCMEKDPFVYIIGQGASDPKGVFGTTIGLSEKHGKNRVFDSPLSENAVTGIAIGSAICGLRPVLVHLRIDFSLLAFDQVVNNAAKWYYMFGGKRSIPIVIRMIIGRGWGQGPQHSQNLQGLYTHIPGLKVVMPTTPYDAKGLLISSIADNNPVIFIEHRWLYNVKDHVPDGYYEVPLGEPKIIRRGNDVTIVSTSYMTVESIKAAQILEKQGIDVEIIDVRTLKPLNYEKIHKSIEKTGKLVVADSGWRTLGFSSEIITSVVEKNIGALSTSPIRITLPDCPTPTSRALTKYYYPRSITIVNSIRKIFGLNEIIERENDILPHDVPDDTFSGPF